MTVLCCDCKGGGGVWSSIELMFLTGTFLMRACNWLRDIEEPQWRLQKHCCLSALQMICSNVRCKVQTWVSFLSVSTGAAQLIQAMLEDFSSFIREKYICAATTKAVSEAILHFAPLFCTTSQLENT